MTYTKKSISHLPFVCVCLCVCIRKVRDNVGGKRKDTVGILEMYLPFLSPYSSTTFLSSVIFPFYVHFTFFLGIEKRHKPVLYCEVSLFSP